MAKGAVIALLLVALQGLAGCAHDSSTSEPPVASPAPPSAWAAPPGSEEPPAAARPSANASAPAASPPVEVFRGQARGTCAASANVPDAVLQGTDVMACSAQFDRLPPKGLVRLVLSFTWTSQVTLGHAGVWLWDGADGNPDPSAYVLRLETPRGIPASIDIPMATWDSVNEPRFLVGAYGGSGAALLKDLTFDVLLVGYGQP